MKIISFLAGEYGVDYVDGIYDNISSVNSRNEYVFHRKNVVSYSESFTFCEILKKEILDESDSDESDGSGSSDDDEDDDDDEENEDEETKKKTDEKVSGMIIYETKTNLVSLRSTIYLTIQSSLYFK